MSLKKLISPFLFPVEVLRLFFRSFSIRVRLTLLFVFIFGVTTLIFSYVLYSQTLITLQQDFDDALFNYAVDVSESVEIGVRGDLLFPPLKFDHGKVLPFPLGTALIQVVHITGAVLSRVGDFGDFSLPYKTDFERIAAGEEAHYRTIENIEFIPRAEADSYRMISFPIDSASRPQLLLQIAVPLTLVDTQLTNRLRFIQIGIPLVLLIATLAGFFVSSRALAPVEAMTRAAREISAHDLSQRLPQPQAKDEIRHLAITMNDMLGRIENAFSSHEKFVADASHQLLTPLTILRGEIELIQKSHSPDYPGFLKSALQEVDHLTKIVRDMLLLARIDAGTDVLNFSEISLDEILLDAIARVRRLAENKNIHLKFDINTKGEAPGIQLRQLIRGEPDLLTNLFVNLIENAIKYSPADQTVSVLLEWTGDHSVVKIEDHGPGIPESQVAFIFDRFSRVPTSSPKVKGYGLGLAIAQKIAKLHDSTLFFEKVSPNGARFTVVIKNI